MDIVADTVKQIVFEQLEVNLDRITLKSRFAEDLGADSLDVVELVMALEEEFDIEISDEDAESILTVEKAVSYIKKSTQANLKKSY